MYVYVCIRIYLCVCIYTYMFMYACVSVLSKEEELSFCRLCVGAFPCCCCCCFFVVVSLSFIHHLFIASFSYFTFFGAGIPLYASIPMMAEWAGASSDMAPLLLFYGATMGIFTMYGGGFATIPAYLADMFGTK